MAKTSAGLLMYRSIGDFLEVLLVHPGGPFWSRRHAGAWFVPKGELNADEEPLAAARREFQEETGVEATGPFMPLGEVRHKSGKKIIVWAVEGSWDTSELRSNTFSLEWPPKSGAFQEFPEVDKAAFLELSEARLRIHESESAFLERLLDGIAVAGIGGGGPAMTNTNGPGGMNANNAADHKHRRVPPSDDRGQPEGHAVTPQHRGHDEAAHGSTVGGRNKTKNRGHDQDTADVDPDSAASKVDRDDTVDK